MPKRKAASRKKQDGADGAKKPRTSAAAAAAAAATHSDDSFESALACALQAPSVATQTLKLVDALKATDGSHTERMQTIVDLLKQDVGRPESLLDLSLVVEGEKVSPQRSHRQRGCSRRPHSQLTSVDFRLDSSVRYCFAPVVRVVPAAALLPGLLQKGWGR